MKNDRLCRSFLHFVFFCGGGECQSAGVYSS